MGQVEFFCRMVEANDVDGIPIKNHLPADLGSQFRTPNQWAESGYYPIEGRRGYEMHPSVMAWRTYIYYHKTDVSTPDGRSPDESRAYLDSEDEIAGALKQSTGSGGLTAHGFGRMFNTPIRRDWEEEGEQ